MFGFGRSSLVLRDGEWSNRKIQLRDCVGLLIQDLVGGELRSVLFHYHPAEGIAQGVVLALEFVRCCVFC